MKVEVRNALLSAAVVVPALALSLSASAQTVTPTVVGTTPVNATVFGATVSPDGKNLWVANYNSTSTPGQVSIFSIAGLVANPASAAASSSIAVGNGPADIAFSSTANRAYVTNFYGQSFSQIKISANSVQQTVPLSPSSFPFGVAYSANQIVVTDQGTSNVVPTFLNSSPIAQNFPSLLPPVASGYTYQTGRFTLPTVGPQAGTAILPLVVSDGFGNTSTGITISNLHTAKLIGAIEISGLSGVSAEQVVLSPNGKLAYVSLFDTTGITDGGIAVIDLQKQKLVSIIDTGDPFGYGLAISADGKYLLATGDFNNQLALVDTATGNVDYIIATGNEPNTIALTKDGSTGFVTNQADGTVSTITFSPSL